MKKIYFFLFAYLSICFCCALSAMPFSEGGVYKWKTNAKGSNGTFKVLSVKGDTCELEQENVAFKHMGKAKFEAVFKGNCLTMKNLTYKETWVGKLDAEKIVGKVKDYYSFEISGDFNKRGVAGTKTSAEKTDVNSQIYSYLAVGTKLTWKTSINQEGTMIVTSFDGKNFCVDQTNIHNKYAGAVKLDGTIADDGAITLTNKKWKETWIGTVSKDKVSGTINKTYTLKISE